MFTATNKGFTITFENGWTASVQFGAGNYCENHWEPYRPPHTFPSTQSVDAEVAAWANDTRETWHDFGHDKVKGYCKPAEVLEFLNMVARKEPKND